MATQATKTAYKGLQEYFSPVRRKLVEKPMRRQMLELHGKIEFGKGNYHNQAYEDLIQSICKTREAFRNTKNLNERKQIATEEYSEWKKYVDLRKNELPDDFKIPEKVKSQFIQGFNVAKDRHTDTIKPEKVMDAHEEYYKLFRFNIPVDHKNLARLIHPHYGYFAYFPNNLTTDEIFSVYDDLLVASYEYYHGQDLLGDELSAFSFWNFFDKENTGYMTVNEFSEFMKVFRYNVEPSVEGIRKEFSFALQLHPGEFDRDIDESKDIVRYDFMRYLFLERDL